MPDVDSQLRAIYTLVQIQKAIRNLQIYPPVDPAITNAIETLYLHLMDTLRQDAPMVFARLDKKSLQGDNIVKQEEKAIPVSSLLDVLLSLGVKNISFDKDLQKEELHIFINLIAKNPNPGREDDKPQKAQAKNQKGGILQENKVYVTTQKDQVIISDADVNEGQITENIAEIQKVFSRLREMDGTIASFLFEEQKERIRKLSRQIVRWLENETDVTPGYKEICLRLQSILQEFINHGLFAEANPVIDVFSRMNTGVLRKDDNVRKVALDVLRNLASEHNINILSREIDINEKNRTTDACRILFGFGDIVIKKLLSMVGNAGDSKERIRIIHIIQEMGESAIPAIRDSMTVDAPWYYLRNMAYLLGRIGNETNADILRPLLLYKDKRVRMEAFKSISQTGGKNRGPVLLSVLPDADPELRVSIIELLGKIKCAEAVTGLQDMLKSRSSMAKDELISLQEKICGALGAIGSPEAVKILSEIAESKSILGIGSYPKEVKYAAERALGYIKRK